MMPDELKLQSGPESGWGDSGEEQQAETFSRATMHLEKYLEKGNSSINLLCRHEQLIPVVCLGPVSQVAPDYIINSVQSLHA